MSTQISRLSSTLFHLLLLLLFAACSDAPDSGRVVNIADGDTITVLRDNTSQDKIRMYGIDCPEKSQPFGQKARQFTRSLVFGKRITFRTMDRDRYGRNIAWVYVGKTNVNAELVRVGYAWHYRKYSDDPVLQRLENEARKAKRGLWSDTAPLPPWDYRNGKRMASSVNRTGNAHAGTLSVKKDNATIHSAILYHGNVSSTKFHLPDCPAYDCKKCTAVFRSRGEAIEAGYKPCQTCKP